MTTTKQKQGGEALLGIGYRKVAYNIQRVAEVWRALRAAFGSPKRQLAVVRSRCYLPKPETNLILCGYKQLRLPVANFLIK